MARGVNSLQTVGASKPRSRFATCTEAAAADDDDDADDAILYYWKVNSDLPTLPMALYDYDTFCIYSHSKGEKSTQGEGGSMQTLHTSPYNCGFNSPMLT